MPANESDDDETVRRRTIACRVLTLLSIGLFVGIVVLLVLEAGSPGCQSKHAPIVWKNITGIDVIVLDRGRGRRASAIVASVLKYVSKFMQENDQIVVYRTDHDGIAFDPLEYEHHQDRINVINVPDARPETIVNMLLMTKPAPEQANRLFLFLGDNVIVARNTDLRSRFIFQQINPSTGHWWRRLGGGVDFDRILFGLGNFEHVWPATPMRYGEMRLSGEATDAEHVSIYTTLSVWLSADSGVILDPSLLETVYVTCGHSERLTHDRVEADTHAEYYPHDLHKRKHNTASLVAFVAVDGGGDDDDLRIVNCMNMLMIK